MTCDGYGRLLRYVDSAGGVDAGLQMINQGWAIARYDSRDGYGRHAREASYVAADAVSPAKGCRLGTRRPLRPGRTTPTALRSAPRHRRPLYRRPARLTPRTLDGDDDGVACE